MALQLLLEMAVILYIDYRHFVHAPTTSRYEFGFGPSYTTFAFSDLNLSNISTIASTTANAPGGYASLYGVVAIVTATVKKITAHYPALKVAQLYIGLPSSTPLSSKQLHGFDKISLAASAPGTVTFNLRRRNLSY